MDNDKPSTLRWVEETTESAQVPLLSRLVLSLDPGRAEGVDANSGVVLGGVLTLGKWYFVLGFKGVALGYGR